MDIAGEWHVIATNFPMWLGGKRSHVRFVYSNVRTENGVTRMDDAVIYRQNGREKRILGVDTATGPQSYRWRGNGWLFFATSDWRITETGPDWMLITFKKSLVSPAGSDLLSRTPGVSLPIAPELTRI